MSVAACRAKRLRPFLLAAIGLNSVAATANAAGVFTDANFTGDADSGINFDSVFTHALNLFTDDNLTVNGAVFTGAGSNTTTPATNTYSVAGTNGPFHNNANNLLGNSNGLARDFVYNGNPQVLTLKNLLVGRQYVTTFYNVGFGPVGDRVVDIATSDLGAVTYDQNKAGSGNGNLLRYTFTATNNTQTFTITPQNPGNTFHTYALSNQLLGFNALLTDNFYIGTNNGDPGGPALLNSNLPARQGGSVVRNNAPVTYTSTGNVQVGNGPTGPVDRGNYLLTASNGNVSPNHNFNGTDPGTLPNGPIIISFDMAPNLGASADTTEWAAINLGLSQTHQNAFVNDPSAHFGILFRGNGGIQAFDGGSDITGSGTGGAGARWYMDDGVNNATNQLHHFDFILSDPALRSIDLYVDGLLLSTFTKPTGFGDNGNNYINFLSAQVAGFDNLQIAQAPEPTTLSLLALLGTPLLTRRRRKLPVTANRQQLGTGN